MIENRAIVLAYVGQELCREHVDNIRQFVATLLNLDHTPRAYLFDEEDLSRCVIMALPIETPSVSNNDELNNAIIYVGTKFETLLHTANLVQFAEVFGTAMTVNKFTNADPRLNKAVKIIAKHEYSDADPAYLRKYHIKKAVFDVIKRIGQNV